MHHVKLMSLFVVIIRERGLSYHVFQAIADVCNPLEDHLLSVHHILRGARQQHAACITPKRGRLGILHDLHLDEKNMEDARVVFES